MSSQRYGGGRHTSSRKWESNDWKNRNNNRFNNFNNFTPSPTNNLQLNEAKRKLCPKSPFFIDNFNDLAKHKKDWKEGEERRAQLSMQEALKQEKIDKQRADLELPPVEVAPIGEAFGGTFLTGNRSAVLLHHTIFCPDWRKDKEAIAPWPSKHEIEYEGDGRIATDKLHRRFPPLPRVDGNETVNWQHRALVPPYALEDFYYPLPDELDICLRKFEMEDQLFREVDGELVLEGDFDKIMASEVFPRMKMEAAVGKELMAALDPVDQW